MLDGGIQWQIICTLATMFNGIPRDFLESPPQGTGAYTKIKLGMIPDRCIGIVNGEEETRTLVPLSSSTLPSRKSNDQYVVLKVPLSTSTSRIDPYWQKVYLLLEYRTRLGQPNSSPDNFTINTKQMYGDEKTDPGYPQCQNPPKEFVPSKGVLVYLVNENLSDNPNQEYLDEEWYNFRLILLNPEGVNDRNSRRSLINAALKSGGSVTIDFRNFYGTIAIPEAITVEVTIDSSKEHAEIKITKTFSG